MAALNQQIRNKVAGDEIPIERTHGGLPTGLVLSKAWIVVKEHENDADADAIIGPIPITTTLTAAGQITDATSSPDLSISFFFLLSPAQSILLTPRRDYHWGTKVKTASGGPYTLDKGTINLEPGIIEADS